MRIRILSLVLLFAVTLGFSTTAKAETARYHFDKAHTQILFFVNHLGFSNSQGEFLDYTGHFTFDPEDVASSTVNVTINSAGIDMDDTAWDDHLKNQDFLNVEKFPKITFKSTKATKTGEKTGTLTGDLTILGVTKPVTLDVTYNRSGVHPYSGKYVAGFSATGVVKRSDYGMSYGLPHIGDEVSLRIEVEGLREDTKPANK